MVQSRFPEGFVLTDMPDELGNGAPWAWVYKKTEVWVGEGDEREMRGYYFVVQSEAGEEFDPEKAQNTAAGPEYDIIAWDSGNIAEGVEVGL